MTIFKTNGKKRVPTFRRTLILFTVIVLLASCSNLNFRKDNFGRALLEIGQLASHKSCNNSLNHNDYSACITQIDENYDEALHELNQKRRSY